MYISNIYRVVRFRGSFHKKLAVIFSMHFMYLFFGKGILIGKPAFPVCTLLKKDLFHWKGKLHTTSLLYNYWFHGLL